MGFLDDVGSFFGGLVGQKKDGGVIQEDKYQDPSNKGGNPQDTSGWATKGRRDVDSGGDTAAAYGSKLAGKVIGTAMGGEQFDWYNGLPFLKENSNVGARGINTSAAEIGNFDRMRGDAFAGAYNYQNRQPTSKAPLIDKAATVGPAAQIES